MSPTAIFCKRIQTIGRELSENFQKTKNIYIFVDKAHNEDSLSDRPLKRIMLMLSYLPYFFVILW